MDNLSDKDKLTLAIIHFRQGLKLMTQAFEAMYPQDEPKALDENTLSIQVDDALKGSEDLGGG